MLKNVEMFGKQNDDITINKKTFCEILSKFSKEQNQIVNYLFSMLNTENLILTTQNSIAETLNISDSIVNRTFKKLIQLKILQKIRNGIYMLER